MERSRRRMEGALEHAMAAMLVSSMQDEATKAPPHAQRAAHVSSVTRHVFQAVSLPHSNQLPARPCSIEAQFPSVNAEEYAQSRRAERGYELGCETWQGRAMNVMHVSSAAGFPLRRQTRERLSSHNQEQLSRIQLEKEERRVKMVTEALLAMEEPSRQEVQRVLTPKEKDLIAFYNPNRVVSLDTKGLRAELANKFSISEQEVLDIWQSRLSVYSSCPLR